MKCLCWGVPLSLYISKRVYMDQLKINYGSGHCNEGILHFKTFWITVCVAKKRKDIQQVLLNQKFNKKSLLGLVFLCHLFKKREREKITTQPLCLKTKTQTGHSGC